MFCQKKEQDYSCSLKSFRILSQLILHPFPLQEEQSPVQQLPLFLCLHMDRRISPIIRTSTAVTITVPISSLSQRCSAFISFLCDAGLNPFLNRRKITAASSADAASVQILKSASPETSPPI